MSFSLNFSHRDSPDEIAQETECVDITFQSSTGQRESTERIRFHDYPKIFAHPGLYEYLFHKHLRCQSPEEVVSLLVKCIETRPSLAAGGPLRILDVGAGNGIVASEIKKQLGVRLGSLVGSDILPEARQAALRDRPDIYNQYVVADLTDERQQNLFGKDQFDIIVTCAALGPEWGDMPVHALLGALKPISDGGLVAITINERWLGKGDETPWGCFIAMLDGRSSGDWKQLRELERKRYKHRLDVKGRWIWYIGVVFEKVRVINGA